MKTFWRAVIEVDFIIFTVLRESAHAEFERSGLGRKNGVTRGPSETCLPRLILKLP